MDLNLAVFVQLFLLKSLNCIIIERLSTGDQLINSPLCGNCNCPNDKSTYYSASKQPICIASPSDAGCKLYVRGHMDDIPVVTPADINTTEFKLQRFYFPEICGILFQEAGGHVSMQDPTVETRWKDMTSKEMVTYSFKNDGNDATIIVHNHHPGLLLKIEVACKFESTVRHDEDMCAILKFSGSVSYNENVPVDSTLPSPSFTISLLNNSNIGTSTNIALSEIQSSQSSADVLLKSSYKISNTETLLPSVRFTPLLKVHATSRMLKSSKVMSTMPITRHNTPITPLPVTPIYTTARHQKTLNISVTAAKMRATVKSSVLMEINVTKTDAILSPSNKISASYDTTIWTFENAITSTKMTATLKKSVKIDSVLTREFVTMTPSLEATSSRIKKEELTSQLTMTKTSINLSPFFLTSSKPEFSHIVITSTKMIATLKESVKTDSVSTREFVTMTPSLEATSSRIKKEELTSQLTMTKTSINLSLFFLTSSTPEFSHNVITSTKRNIAKKETVTTERSFKRSSVTMSSHLKATTSERYEVTISTTATSFAFTGTPVTTKKAITTQSSPVTSSQKDGKSREYSIIAVLTSAFIFLIILSCVIILLIYRFRHKAETSKENEADIPDENWIFADKIGEQKEDDKTQIDMKEYGSSSEFAKENKGLDPDMNPWRSKNRDSGFQSGNQNNNTENTDIGKNSNENTYEVLQAPYAKLDVDESDLYAVVHKSFIAKHSNEENGNAEEQESSIQPKVTDC